MPKLHSTRVFAPFLGRRAAPGVNRRAVVRELIGCRGDKGAVRAEREARKVPSCPVQREQLLAGFYFPELDLVIRSHRRHAQTIGVEGQRSGSALLENLKLEHLLA